MFVKKTGRLSGAGGVSDERAQTLWPTSPAGDERGGVKHGAVTRVQQRVPRRVIGAPAPVWIRGHDPHPPPRRVVHRRSMRLVLFSSGYSRPSRCERRRNFWCVRAECVFFLLLFLRIFSTQSNVGGERLEARGE